MVTITFNRNRASKRIVAFFIEGHADAGVQGEDIVCAAISAISIGTVNSIEHLTGVELPASMQEGWLSSPVAEQANLEIDAKIQLLLESMAFMLSGIAEHYSEFAQVHETFID